MFPRIQSFRITKFISLIYFSSRVLVFCYFFHFFVFWRNEFGYENGCGNIWRDVLVAGSEEGRRSKTNFS